MTIWMLPQNLLGFIVAILTGFRYNEKGFFEWNLHSGISLGWYIFLPCGADEMMLKHERGHQMQSMCLGWLYLIIIGIPSLLWASYWRFHRNKDYYSLYTERWANRLGGVEESSLK